MFRGTVKYSGCHPRHTTSTQSFSVYLNSSYTLGMEDRTLIWLLVYVRPSEQLHSTPSVLSVEYSNLMFERMYDFVHILVLPFDPPMEPMEICASMFYRRDFFTTCSPLLVILEMCHWPEVIKVREWLVHSRKKRDPIYLVYPTSLLTPVPLLPDHHKEDWEDRFTVESPGFKVFFFL